MGATRFDPVLFNEDSQPNELRQIKHGQVRIKRREIPDIPTIVDPTINHQNPTRPIKIHRMLIPRQRRHPSKLDQLPHIRLVIRLKDLNFVCQHPILLLSSKRIDPLLTKNVLRFLIPCVVLQILLLYEIWVDVFILVA